MKGYLPGVRENAGQYTHAAAWVVQAAARLGQGRRAFEYLRILNPIYHTRDPEGVNRYKVEPYVIAGDVYGCPPHAGRGGWTWYTGSASWVYRVILESVLGIQRLGDRLLVNPCIPPDWTGYNVTYRFRSSVYRIQVEKPAGALSGMAAVWLDNRLMPEQGFPLLDDGQTHQVRVAIRPQTQEASTGQEQCPHLEVADGH